MRKSKSDVALKLLEECLGNIESNKPLVTQAVQKLLRASELIDEDGTYEWCESQMGEKKYVDFYQEMLTKSENDNFSQKDMVARSKELDIDIIYPSFLDELKIRLKKSSGGLKGIAFAEERYNILVKEKRGNDNIYYRNPLSSYIKYVARETHERAKDLYNKLNFSHLPISTFDLLRYEVEEKLFDIDPELTEQLLNSFGRVSGSAKEDWAQALTTSRRVVISLADALFPSQVQQYKQRAVGEQNYVNRLWAFMDSNIESIPNKELAQRHLEYLKFYIEKDVRLLNKGVHSTVTQLDAVKAIHHTYLLIADILQYIDKPNNENVEISIMEITYNELLEIGVKDKIAKSIIRYRVDNPNLNTNDLIEIQGVGKKTIDKIINYITP